MLTTKGQKMKAAMQPVLCHWMKEYRMRNDLTQENMSQKLMITLRAYVRLEKGESFPSALSLAYFLTLLSKEEFKDILNELRGEIDKVR